MEQNNLFLILTSFSTGSGFCDISETMYNDETYTWPEIEAGGIVRLPCIFSSDVATRQCGSDRVWLQPNNSLCDDARSIITEILSENVKSISVVS